jgi:hypothetical protein
VPSFSFLSNTRPFAFAVDDVYVLDFENPEANGFGILAFKIEDIKSDDKHFLYDKAKLILTNAVTDLADIPHIAGRIVLGGQAFHLAMPSVPEFFKEQYEDLFALEETRCSKTEEQYELHINRIANDKGRSKHTALFVLPDGFAFSDDFTTADASPSIMDRKMNLFLRVLQVVKPIEPKGPKMPQTFYPGFFELRVLSCNAASKNLKPKSKGVASFSSYFSGMKVTDEAMKGEQEDEEY